MPSAALVAVLAARGAYLLGNVARQVEVAKQFLLDNLGQIGAQPFLDGAPKPEKKPPAREWI